MIIIIFPDLTRHSVIHGLQVSSVSNARYQECWIFIDVSTPGFVHQFITNHNVSVCKCLRHKTPEQSEPVQQTIDILVEVTNRVRETGAAVVIND